MAISAQEERRRKIVGVNAETVTNTTSTDFPGHYVGEDHAWDLEQFRNAFQVQFHRNLPLESSFSLINIDASIANAFRRILLAEIPALAIEDVYIYNNTSVMSDEVLAHRLGLLPLTGNVEGIKRMKWCKRPSEERPTEKESNDSNTIEMKLKVECTWAQGQPLKGGTDDPKKLYLNSHVYAKDMTFHPVGRQEKIFGQKPEDRIRPVNPDVLLLQLRPGQLIDMLIHCHKGIGADHAKFSPVATATYRLLPTIDILKPIVGADAKKFARCFPKGVIGLEDITDEEASTEGTEYEGKAGEKKAVVRNTMKDTVSRECLRHDEFEGKVKLGRIRDHFIFQVESTGQFDSDDLFLESVRGLRSKCKRLRRNLDNMMR